MKPTASSLQTRPRGSPPKTVAVVRSEGRAAIASRHATAMPSVTNFCSELTGDVLTACKSIPESCVSLNTPPFSQIVGEPELFIRIKKVIQEASLGTHRFFVLGPGRGTTATHEAAKARPHRHTAYRCTS